MGVGRWVWRGEGVAGGGGGGIGGAWPETGRQRKGPVLTATTRFLPTLAAAAALVIHDVVVTVVVVAAAAILVVLLVLSLLCCWCYRHVFVILVP